jgi:hypothetical protein
MLRVGAKPPRKPRPRERGAQVQPTKGMRDEFGKWHYGPVSDERKAQYAETLRKKRGEARKDAKIALLQARIVADQLRHVEEMEAETLRKRAWNGPGSSNSAFKRAVLVNAQPTLTTNLSSLQGLRASEGLAPYERGENPERTSIQRVQRNIEFGVCKVLEPQINALYVSFPLSQLLSVHSLQYIK